MAGSPGAFSKKTFIYAVIKALIQVFVVGKLRGIPNKKRATVCVKKACNCIFWNLRNWGLYNLLC